MKHVFFDLGNTLEAGGVPVPQASNVLQAIQSLRDKNGAVPWIGLISDYKEAASTAELESFKKEYYSILEVLGFREFFEPVEARVTLSSEAKVRKPHPDIFRSALDKAGTNTPFSDAAFVTESANHVAAARKLGLFAVCVKGCPQPQHWDVENLTEVVPLITSWLSQ